MPFSSNVNAFLRSTAAPAMLEMLPNISTEERLCVTGTLHVNDK